MFKTGVYKVQKKDISLWDFSEGQVSLLRKDIVVERLFSRIPEKDSAFSNWGNSWWKLTDEWKALMEERQYVQGIRCDYLNGAALNRWEM